MRDMIERLCLRLLMAIGRGKTTFGDDSGNVQIQQVRLGPDEVRDGIPRLAEYGFTSMPPVGCDAVVLFAWGERSDGVIIATGHETYRLKNLKSGEVAIYDSIGQSILLTKTGIVINGNATLNGTLTVTQDVVVNGKSFNNHRHSGVSAGAANTGVPV